MLQWAREGDAGAEFHTETVTTPPSGASEPEQGTPSWLGVQLGDRAIRQSQPQELPDTLYPAVPGAQAASRPLATTASYHSCGIALTQANLNFRREKKNQQNHNTVGPPVLWTAEIMHSWVCALFGTKVSQATRSVSSNLKILKLNRINFSARTNIYASCPFKALAREETYITLWHNWVLTDWPTRDTLPWKPISNSTVWSQTWWGAQPNKNPNIYKFTKYKQTETYRNPLRRKVSLKTHLVSAFLPTYRNLVPHSCSITIFRRVNIADILGNYYLVYVFN